ncbi:S-layer homology domain-containing protein [Lysinibacillus telephonicus]|uniref:S-layer homology domain-containing protein n=1 Tax=Lysinibacillus telephonicus TaxID=1714840 RepID=UPI003B9E0859
MANQPKKYKKFVATAATATLVASAIVPVASAAASFPDVAENNSHAEAINALVEAGIIKGYEDGTFKPNAQLTRGHVVKMLGKWVEAQGFEIPADYNTVQRFDDVAVDAADQELVKYAALVKDTGVFLGSDGDLNAADSITRENMALTLDRAYKAVFKKSLVELAAGSTNLTVSDLATAKEEAREEIQALRNLGISNVNTFNPKDTVTRAQFASFLHRTIEAQGTPSTEVGAIKLTASKVNELTVEFDAPVKDTEAAKFAVARGTTAISVTDVDWSEDKKTAVLTVDTKFVDATYTVTVSGVAEKELTASVTTKREEVTSINFLSDKLVFTGVEKSNYKQAVIAFEVLNQYGEDITKDVNASRYVNEDISGIDAAGKNDTTYAPKAEQGRFIVWVDEDEDDDETGTVEFTYENGDLEIDVEQDVQLSDVAEPGSVELVKIYNSSDKELSTDNLEDVADDTEEFFLLFNVKDQYGVEIDPEFADDNSDAASGDTTILEEVRDGLRFDVSNDDIFELDDEEEIEAKNIDGEWYFALKLTVDDKDDLVGGENTVSVRAKATGEETSKVFTVTDSEKVFKVELLAPDEVVAGGEEVLLPILATDQFGETITDTSKLNDLLDGQDPGIKIDWDSEWVENDNNQAAAFTFIEKDGQVYLKFETADNKGPKAEAEELDIDIEVDDSGEESSITLNVEPNAYADTLVKVKDTADTYLYKGTSVELKLKDFVIEDQYGRVFDDKNSDYPVTITAESQNKDNFTTSGDSASVIGITSRNDANATIEFTLNTKDFKGEAVTDKLSVTFRSVDEDDFDKYAVYSDELLYGVDGNDRAGIEVYGVLSNGVEVELPTSAYTVLAGDKLESDGTDVFAKASAATKLAEHGVTRFDSGVTVVINKDGSQIDHKIVVADEDPIITSFKLKDDESIAGNLLSTLDITFDNVSDGNLLDYVEIFEALEAQGTYEFEDQYGNEYEEGKNDTENPFLDENGVLTLFNNTDAKPSTEKLRLTITNINSENDDDVVISKNGSNLTSITLGGDNGLNKGDSFDLTLTIDGKTQKLKVYVK